MARVELPESRLRLRKRRRRLRVSLLIVLLLAVVGGVCVGLAYIPALQVQAVAVAGTRTLSPNTLETFARDRLAGTYWYVLPKSNIFLYPKRQIAADLMSAYPVLASADVHANDFQSIAVNVVEREPRALWCEEVRCFFMDENGVAYGEAPVFSEPIYLTYKGALGGDRLPKQYLTPAEFQALSALVDAIAQKLADEQIQAVSVDTAKDVTVQFVSGFTLRFALQDQGGDVFERFTLALTADPLATRKLSDFEYLDLRFGDKLYYKLR